VLAAIGLAVYLWPAFQAPVVLWSDSQVDLEWAKAGLGIFRPIPLPPPGTPIGHLPKPGYLLFLRLATRVFPSLGEARSVVAVQAALVAISILATSFWIARRRGFASGLGLAAVCIVFLRLRDASSAVMSEALAAAILLPIGAALLEPSRRPIAGFFLGLASGVLFLVRPNCGGASLLLAAACIAAAREGRRILLLLAGFAVLILPFWYAGRSSLRGDPLRGLGYQIVEGSADYYWAPSIEPWPAGATPEEAARRQLEVSRARWRDFLASRGPDRNRELVWRALHGLLGVEYYDSRWSAAYAAATTASRWLSPVLILGSVALLLAAPRRPDGPARLAGLLLLAVLVGQGLLLGSNPRYALPFFPVLFLFAVWAAGRLRGAGRARRAVVLVSLAALLAVAAWQRQVLDWQWGRIERAGVTLRQTIPPGGLPSRGPAVLHIRIAPADPRSDAHLVVASGGESLFSSRAQTDRGRPYLSIPLPRELLEHNAREPVELTLTSAGAYGEESYLLFPVIPPPWERPALREGGGLSPSTGIAVGALDWWAHQGTR
jgi:hypothetical protein